MVYPSAVLHSSLMHGRLRAGCPKAAAEELEHEKREWLPEHHARLQALEERLRGDLGAAPPSPPADVLADLRDQVRRTVTKSQFVSVGVVLGPRAKLR
jgi:hypothetical protein